MKIILALAIILTISCSGQYPKYISKRGCYIQKNSILYNKNGIYCPQTLEIFIINKDYKVIDTIYYYKSSFYESKQFILEAKKFKRITIKY